MPRKNRPKRKPFSQKREKDLIAKAKKGDHRAFQQLFREYEGTVLRYAYSVCRDRDQAREALQDTFVGLYRKLDQYDGRAKFSTWLYSIVTNHCLMKRRSTKMQKATVAIDELRQEPKIRRDFKSRQPQLSPLEQAMNGDLRNALEKAIVKLPLKYRLVFVLKDLEGLTTEQIARVLNISNEATKSRLRRARSSLREDLTDFVPA